MQRLFRIEEHPIRDQEDGDRAHGGEGRERPAHPQPIPERDLLFHDRLARRRRCHRRCRGRLRLRRQVSRRGVQDRGTHARRGRLIKRLARDRARLLETVELGAAARAPGDMRVHVRARVRRQLP
jgi:hypothetical protein